MSQSQPLTLPDALGPTCPAAATLLAHWESLRGCRAAPDWRTVRPDRLGAALSEVFVIEASRSGAASFRLAGSGIFELFRRELRGLDCLTLFAEDARPAAQATLDAVLRDGDTALLHADGFTARGRRVEIEILLLPLVGPASEQARAVGTLSACDRPYWLGAQPIVEISGLRAASRAVRPEPVDVPSDDVPAPRNRRSGPIRRLRHLALYLGGESTASDTHR